jgi:tetratricopeptide (TPR) repeat protein
MLNFLEKISLGPTLVPNKMFGIRVSSFVTLVGCFLLVSSGCSFMGKQNNAAGKKAYDAGQLSIAATEFQKAVKANPRDADALYNLGSTYYAMSKQNQNTQWTAQAEQLFRQAISIDDKHTEAHRALAALLIETGQEKYAFDLLNSWRTRYPNSTEPLVELARLYQEYGDNRRSADYLADALRINGKDIRALKGMGHVREKQGEIQLALDNYYRVLQIDSRQTDVANAVQRLQTTLAQSGAPGSVPGTNPAQPRYGSAAPYNSVPSSVNSGVPNSVNSGVPNSVNSGVPNNVNSMPPQPKPF